MPSAGVFANAADEIGRQRAPIDELGSNGRYYLVTQAVREGSLLNFNEVVHKYDTLFKQDRTSTLIVR
jgi:hypothetical protein